LKITVSRQFRIEEHSRLIRNLRILPEAPLNPKPQLRSLRLVEQITGNKAVLNWKQKF
jgi:hypothetical protein